MDFGMPTLVELPNLEENVRLCAELGLQFVELNMNLPEYADVARLNRDRLKTLMRDYGVYFTLHLDERMDVCDFNIYIAEGYLTTLHHALNLAEEIGIPVLNLHMSSGIYVTLPDQKVYLYQQNERRYFAALERMQELVEREAAEGIAVCVENTNGFPNFMRRGIELLLESPRFGLTLDVGHMHCAWDADADFYQAHMNRLHHLHLHDAMHTGCKCHLPLGEGELDWRAKLALAERHGCRTVVEIKTQQALCASAKVLRGEKWL